MKSWAASLALHGTVAGMAALLWLDSPAEPEPAPLRWQVAFAPAPVAPPADEPAPPPPPDKPVPPPPAPAPDPRPVPAPQPIPAPLPAVLPPPESPPSESVVLPVSRLAPPVPPPHVQTPAAPPRPEAAMRAPVPLVVPVLTKPTPATPMTEAAAEVERRWYLALLERLRAMKRYPMVARRLGQEGVVLIEARIGQDGRLEAATVKRGSGYPMLDQDALRLLEDAAETARGQLQPERPTRLEIPIAYRLDG